MDKNIWLKVIKQELGLLDQLASGMMEDQNLSKEEVELALTRSKVVVSEFEMLLHQVCTNKQEAGVTSARENGEKSPAAAKSERVMTAVPEPAIAAIPDPVILPKEESKHVPEVLITEAEPDVVRQIVAPVVPPVAQPAPVTETREEPNVLYDEQTEAVSQFKAAPLKSLKEGLSLNDRFLFQRELFDNDKSKLDDTVAALDRLSNIKDAVDFMKSNFRWTKNEASEKFVQLVKRRFS